MSRYKEKYESTVKPALHKKFGYGNVMQIPRLKKIVVSMGVAEALKDKKALQDAEKEIALITGQKPQITKAKKSVANFKLREGQSIGLKVTIRGKRMYDFLDRFNNVVSPRIRDFRGFKPGGDKRGNYSVGLSDQQMFPELNLDEVNRDQGMNVTFVTSANTDEECHELLLNMGFPFQKGDN